MIRRLVSLILAGSVADDALRDAIAGDLIEDHAIIVSERGLLSAELWLVRQLVASFPHFASLASRESRPGMPCGGLAWVARFYGTLGVLVAMSAALAFGFAWTAARLVDSLLLLSVASMAGSALGGFAAAHIARRAPLVAALAVGVMCAGIGVGALLLGDVHAPHAPWTALQFSIIPAALFGGLFRAGQLARTNRRLTIADGGA